MSLPLQHATGISSSDVFARADTPSIPFTEFTLDNGLHVILHEDHRTPIVTVGVMYHVGSKNDEPHRRGFAHFFEHLLFEGSKHIDRGAFSRHVEEAGGMLNANTSADRTYYYEILPANRLELGLWLESERMLHARVDRIGVDTQREVVKEEWRQNYQNRPYGSILPEVLARAYADHPYRWPVIGEMKDLEAADEEDFRAFYKRYYVPNNAVLVLAGDLRPEMARELVQRYFGDIPPGPAVVQPPAVAGAIGGALHAVVHDRIQLPAAVHAYRIPALGDPGQRAMELAGQVLSAGGSSRLERALKDRHQLAVQVGAFNLPFEQGGLAVLFAIANEGVDPEALTTAMDAEVDRMRQEEITTGELERLRARIKTGSYTELARVAGVAHMLATAHTFMGGAHRIKDEIAARLAIAPDAIRQATHRHLDPAHRVVLHYVPEPQAA